MLLLRSWRNSLLFDSQCRSQSRGTKATPTTRQIEHPIASCDTTDRQCTREQPPDTRQRDQLGQGGAVEEGDEQAKGKRPAYQHYRGIWDRIEQDKSTPRGPPPTDSFVQGNNVGLVSLGALLRK